MLSSNMLASSSNITVFIITVILGISYPQDSVHFHKRPQNCEKQLLSSSCLSSCPSARNNSAPTGRVFIKIDKRIRKSVEKFQVSLNFTRITGILQKDLDTFMIICR